MKPLIQKLSRSQQTSFVAKTYTTPYYETTWHQHNEVELIVQLKGNGMCVIGNYIGNYKEGDVFLLGSNLPHEFKKEKENMKCSVMVVHFDPDFWGKDFWTMPESGEIKQLLNQSQYAIKLNGDNTTTIGDTIRKIETASGFERITLLFQCLLSIARQTHRVTLSTLDAVNFVPLAEDKINKLLEFTISQFRESISLTKVASMANMSVSAFCRYFKHNTKKTYVEFVNEIRIGHACQSLIHTDRSITDICYECGFNTIANFNKQFLKVKGIKPSAYRKKLRLQAFV